MAVREFHDQFERLPGEHRARRVVRIVDDDEARAVRDGRAELVEVGLEVGGAQPDGAMEAAAERDEAAVGVVERFEGDDLVARLQQGEDRGGECLGGPGGDQDFGPGVDGQVVEALLVPGDGVEEHRHAAPRRVLVDAVGDGLARRFEYLRGAVLIGEALPEVDGARPAGQGAHLSEDACGDAAVVGEESGPAGRAAPGAGDRHRVTCMGSKLRHVPSAMSFLGVLRSFSPLTGCITPAVLKARTCAARNGGAAGGELIE